MPILCNQLHVIRYLICNTNDEIKYLLYVFRIMEPSVQSIISENKTYVCSIMCLNVAVMLAKIMLNKRILEYRKLNFI